MRFTNSLFAAMFLFAALLFVGCKPDSPEPENEEEVITNVTFTLTPTTGGAPVAMTFVDLDGDGGNAPTITGGTLAANTTYNTVLLFQNLADGENENITEEVVEEALEHQVFYTASNGLAITTTYDDMDSDGNPLGVMATVATGAAGSGTLTVTLRHEPNKTATGVSGGDITNAGGETDVEVAFDVTIQ